VHPGRENLVAVLAGELAPEEGGELLLWDVHQDTVPVDGMTVDPFGGEVRDGRVYGRGACDVKGSMAAMLGAMSRASGERLGGVRRAGPTVVVAFTVNEECGFTGSRAVCQLWESKPRTCEVVAGTIAAEQVFPRRPDAAIVAEPTRFNVVVAHQGSVRWRCHTIGRAAHTSRPDEGVNAIYAMAGVVRAIESYHAELAKSGIEHPLCGRPSVCVSTIHGGVGINTVPERATIEIDRRLGPEERPDEAYQQIIQFIAERADLGRCRIEYDPPFMASGGLSDRNNRAIAERVHALTREAGLPSELVGVPFGTDAAILSAVGVPTIVFGPGSIAQAHTADEFIELEQLERATEIFCRIAREGVCADIH
jgi:acetylornithine deacetylase